MLFLITNYSEEESCYKIEDKNRVKSFLTVIVLFKG